LRRVPYSSFDSFSSLFQDFISGPEALADYFGGDFRDAAFRKARVDAVVSAERAQRICDRRFGVGGDGPQQLLDTFGEVRTFGGERDWHLRIVQHSPLSCDARPETGASNRAVNP